VEGSFRAKFQSSVGPSNRFDTVPTGIRLVVDLLQTQFDKSTTNRGNGVWVIRYDTTRQASAVADRDGIVLDRGGRSV